MVKQSDVLDNYNRHAVNRYMPVCYRREFTPEELARIEAGKSRLIPKIFKTKSDDITADMASPLASALFGGVGMGGIGGLIGGALGSTLSGGKGVGILAGAGIGGGIGGLAGAILNYNRRKAKNADLAEYMRRLPVNANRRDMESDPVYQAEMDRMAQLAAARYSGRRNGGGSFSPRSFADIRF